MRLLAICVFLVLLSPMVAGGAFLETSATIPDSPNDWSETVQLQAFDPERGILIKVHFSVEGHFAGEIRHENLGFMALSYDDMMMWALYVTMDLTTRGGSLITFDDTVQVSADLHPFDGMQDFDGASGNTHEFYTPITGGIVIQGSYAQDFMGTGLVEVQVVSSGATELCTGESICMAESNSSCGATVTILYEYIPYAVANEEATWGDVKNLYR